MGVAVPPTVILPHKKYPEGTNERSMRNLEYPLDWDGVFNYVGEHGFMKTVEFAVENGIPYAIDFMNPAPDADLHSVGEANFEWIVSEVAALAIAKAKTAPSVPELKWSAFLGAAPSPAKAAKKKKTSAKK